VTPGGVETITRTGETDNSSGSEVYIHYTWKIPENYVMALEASDRLIDNI
jgi:hypothetical protein